MPAKRHSRRFGRPRTSISPCASWPLHRKTSLWPVEPRLPSPFIPTTPGRSHDPGSLKGHRCETSHPQRTPGHGDPGHGAPSLEPGDCLLRVESALVCGTDIRIYEGKKKKNVTYPTVMGHEFSGTVVQSNGPLPEGLELGDLVAVYPIVPCGRCAACVRGRENICRNRMAFGYQIPGGFAEYVHVPAAAMRAGNLVKVNGVHPNSAAVIEPLACAYNGLKLIDAPVAKALLVVGCGPLGLMHIRLARALGVEQIVAVDPSEQRLKVAAESGARLTLTPEANTAREIRDFIGGDGVDAWW
ncbi:zinc-dependent alcohol dehydrogenase [Nesterenkonia sp. PF2B19]|uniref:zinc-dependent alcohol dehydrogenase n=1 Tax=Nesterenkonia sp. PF2B19 TaxID=1881858 RepID=UPI00191C816D|nr:alcohol dehydrogenase catalytic domain-containing protein [Nesterenkonia sp. PF2B19]